MRIELDHEVKVGLWQRRGTRAQKRKGVRKGAEAGMGLAWEESAWDNQSNIAKSPGKWSQALDHQRVQPWCCQMGGEAVVATVPSGQAEGAQISGVSTIYPGEQPGKHPVKMSFLQGLGST